MLLDQNSQELVSTTITRVRIHERWLVHVAKHMGSVEPNVQQSLPNTSWVSFELDICRSDTTCWNHNFHYTKTCEHQSLLQSQELGSTRGG